MVRRWFIALVTIGLLLWTTNAEFYSSTDHMTQLIDIERDFIQSFKDYITAEEFHLARLKRCLPFIEYFSGDFPEDLEKYISNPLTAYVFVRRLKHKWTVVEETARLSPMQGFQTFLSENGPNIPSDEDVDGIALGLVRLQETYMLHPDKILGGLGQQSVKSLSPDEAFHIAMVAHRNNKFLYTFLWMEEVLRQLDTGREATVTRKEVLSFLAPFVFQMGDLPRAIRLTEQLLDLDPSDPITASHLEFYKHMKEGVSRDETHAADAEAHLFTPSLARDVKAYEALCRGENIRMTPRRQRALFCRYSTGGRNPRLIYAPVKEEDEWDAPKITRYHNFLSDDEIGTIKKLSAPKLERAQVLDHITGKNYSVEIRVSKSAWLSDGEDPVVSRVNRRIADATGLDMKMAEKLQVANYGIGGQYEPHYDSKFANDEEFQRLGGRIATTLIYMTDVDVGGATVFPAIGAALRPEKGSAVFWYNLLLSGKEDDRTLHAACPVMVGNKWVSNKWIRARGQEFRRRCGLSESD
ncbi:prolyl 4-hydroxylase subunit alpha-2-like [Anguilla anguilla]|uniref:prolyl 4-hydroxylase subunit alpha-2-like n=1 Tax=Anguilla anguilla TaxID=7936 RepID=UPI0015AC406B|nr:prolyl 4-hydroxylase subunit alpha-2-like [Anguilla anguilla]